ncbi:MAG: metallophosphoesterase [Acidimicrobiales bacterium]|nr:metallophosphoesterase [Acidimicrobiales bacterium]
MRTRARRVAVAAVLAAMLAAALPAAASSDYQPVPLPGWQMDGQTYAVVSTGSVVYVGGSFSRVTAPDGSVTPRANLAAFDLNTGALLTSFRADANGSVRSLVTDGTTLWVGGYFSTIAGAARQRLAAVDGATGAVRSGFRADANAPVFGLDLRAGRLFVGGAFRTVNGATRTYAAAVAPATGVLSAFAPTPDTTVNGIRADATGSRVYLGGNFATVGGQPHVGLAAVDGSTGAVLGITFTHTYPAVFGVDLEPSGQRVFAAVGGSGNQAAAFDTVTGARIWSQRADGDTQAISYANGTLYFGFHEGFGGDTTVRLLAADAVTGAIDPAFRPTFDRFWGIRALAATPAGLLGGGDFALVSGVNVGGLVRFPLRPPPATTTTTTSPTTTSTSTSTTTTSTTTSTSTTTTTAPAGGPVTYLGTRSIWRYQASEVAAAATWAAPGFDDSTWAQGPSQLGFGDGDEATVVPGGSPNRFPTIYFRTTFTAGKAPTSINLALLADDGAAIYVNGVEVVRDNLPAGALSYGTLASSNRSGAAESLFRSFTVDPAIVTPGLNTVAIEVHQDSLGSSDLSMDLRLSGVTPA